MYRGMLHGRPVVNGYSAFAPPHYSLLRHDLERFCLDSLETTRGGRSLDVVIWRADGDAPRLDAAAAARWGVSAREETAEVIVYRLPATGLPHATRTDRVIDLLARLPARPSSSVSGPRRRGTKIGSISRSAAYACTRARPVRLSRNHGAFWPDAVASAADQQPVFRTGIEILTVDATVVDREGRQITDLKPTEFQVEVDGDPRPVVSAEYVKLVDDTPMPVGAPQARARQAEPGRSVLFDQRPRADARPIDPAARRSGQHPRRPGPADDAERRQVRRRPRCRPIASRWSRSRAAPSSTSRPNTRKCAKALLATVGLATPLQGPLSHQPQRGDRDGRTQRRDAAAAAVPARMRRRR